VEENAMTQLTVTPLGSSLGAEVSGVDLSQPVDAATRQALSVALAEHLALVFHDQTLTAEQYLEAATVFGPPMRQHYSQHNMENFPDIGLVHHRNGQKVSERWHTDHTNRVRPPAATMLYGVEIPTSGGGTSIANMRAAYQALPEKERARIEGFRTVNSLDDNRRETTRPEDWEKYSRPIVHPMVRTHPIHGSRAVFFHIGKTVSIEGMGPDESQEYLSGLIDRMMKPEIIYTHKWRKGDVLVFDDRATMHRAHGDYDRSQSRVLWRIIVEGDEPRFS
jgi:taurine dioxygenase